MEALKNRFAVVLTIILVLQICLYYSAHGLEKTPNNRPLAFFPTDFDGWHTVQDTPLDNDVQEILRADDTLNRVYVSPLAPLGLNCFVAYFKTQRTGQSPHSPKNCLPGAGWEPVQEDSIKVAMGSGDQRIAINRYIVERGTDARLVLYWYQSRSRVVANEFAAKFWLVADSIRYHRSDTALVRVEVPLAGKDNAQATQIAVRFVQALFPLLTGYLPA